MSLPQLSFFCKGAFRAYLCVKGMMRRTGRIEDCKTGRGKYFGLAQIL